MSTELQRTMPRSALGCRRSVGGEMLHVSRRRTPTPSAVLPNCSVFRSSGAAAHRVNASSEPADPDADHRVACSVRGGPSSSASIVQLAGAAGTDGVSQTNG